MKFTLDWLKQHLDTDLNDKEIIHVSCKKSDEPIYINDKDFYIRTGPATDKLEGRELVNYTTSRFKG